jgi:hypothetical protein
MLKLPVTFDRFTPRADGGYGFAFTSAREMDREEVAVLHDHVRTMGWIIYDENEVQESDLPKEEAEGKLTHSQRQRNILFRLWEQNGKPGEFRDYYNTQEDKINNMLKSKLDPV